MALLDWTDYFDSEGFWKREFWRVDEELKTYFEGETGLAEDGIACF